MDLLNLHICTLTLPVSRASSLLLITTGSCDAHFLTIFVGRPTRGECEEKGHVMAHQAAAGLPESESA